MKEMVLFDFTQPTVCGRHYSIQSFDQPIPNRIWLFADPPESDKLNIDQIAGSFENIRLVDDRLLGDMVLNEKIPYGKIAHEIVKAIGEDRVDVYPVGTGYVTDGKVHGYALLCAVIRMIPLDNLVEKM